MFTGVWSGLIASFSSGSWLLQATITKHNQHSGCNWLFYMAVKRHTRRYTKFLEFDVHIAAGVCKCWTRELATDSSSWQQQHQQQTKKKPTRNKKPTRTSKKPTRNQQSNDKTKPPQHPTCQQLAHTKQRAMNLRGFRHCWDLRDRGVWYHHHPHHPMERRRFLGAPLPLTVSGWWIVGNG